MKCNPNCTFNKNGWCDFLKTNNKKEKEEKCPTHIKSRRIDESEEIERLKKENIRLKEALSNIEMVLKMVKNEI